MLSLSEADVVALTLVGEAAGEPIEGKICVACVLRNRKISGRWGSTYESVCLAPKQFSCWNPGTDANHRRLMALADAVRMGTAVDPTLRECEWIAAGLIDGRLRDRIKGATHYYEASIDPPAWARTGHLIERVGHHLFFAGVA